MMQVSDVMTRGVRTLQPEDTVIMAAQAMEEMDIGVIPVCDEDGLVGILTDRDIAVRVVAQGLTPQDTTLEQVMTTSPYSCFEDQSIEEVLEEMREAQIRRVPVVNQQEQVIGMLSLGDVAVRADEIEAGETLASISEPAEPVRSGQSQSSSAAGGGPASGEPRGSQG